MRIDLYVHDGDAVGRIEDKLDALIDQLTNFEDRTMQTFADLQAEVTAEDTVIDSAVVLINGLAAQIAALEPNQAAIDALVTDVRARATALGAAVAAGTPPAPPIP